MLTNLYSKSFCLKYSLATVTKNENFTKIFLIFNLSASRKSSNIPALPRVTNGPGSNGTNSQNTVRPSSVENINKPISINYANVNGNANHQKPEQKILNTSAQFSSESTHNLKKVKNISVEKNGVSFFFNLILLFS